MIEDNPLPDCYGQGKSIKRRYGAVVLSWLRLMLFGGILPSKGGMPVAVVAEFSVMWTKFQNEFYVHREGQRAIRKPDY